MVYLLRFKGSLQDTAMVHRIKALPTRLPVKLETVCIKNNYLKYKLQLYIVILLDPLYLS